LESTIINKLAVIRIEQVGRTSEHQASIDPDGVFGRATAFDADGVFGRATAFDADGVFGRATLLW
jgi:hypothetical protein